MKKFLFALALLGLTTTTVSAQETEVPTKKYSVATNSFWANWFISAGISGNAFYTSQEASEMNGNPFSDKRGTLGFTVAVGKWFTPSIGLRTKFDGVWGKQVNSDKNHPLYNMVNIHEDVLFNLSNMFCG
ncbi:outer membrane protein OmpA family protein, partial [gut metagenome]